MRRLLLLLIMGGGAGFWWLRRAGRAGDAAPEPAGANTPYQQPRLGGEIAPELLEILACPLDKERVERAGNFLVCQQCQRHYPIRDGIPVMLVDEALTPEQAATAR